MRSKLITILRVVTPAVVATVLTSCDFVVNNPSLNVKAPVTVGTVSGGTGSSALSCSAALDSSSGGVAHSGQAVVIDLQANGGVAPYTINSSGNFSSQTTISRTYVNTSTSNESVNDSITIADSSGETASCNFTVTVVPANSQSSLSCTLSAAISSPHIGDTFPFTISASGGTAPYQFTSFNPGSNGTEIGTISTISSSQAQAEVSYSAAGTQLASATVTDSANHSVSCPLSLTVRQKLSIQVTTSPSSTVTAGTPVTLAASSTGFMSTPTYTFTTTDSNVVIQPNGSSALVSENAADSFTVVVTASNNGESVSINVPVTFTASMPLSCTLTPSASSASTNSTVNFTLTANTGEALQIISFNPGTDGSVTGTLSASYSSSGTKNASVLARSATSGTYCNSGSAVQASVYIYSGLSCSVIVSSTQVAPYSSFVVQALVNADSSAGTVSLVSLSSNSSGGFGYNWPNPSYAPSAWFTNTGSWPVTVTVQDSIGQTATCTTTEVVSY